MNTTRTYLVAESRLNFRDGPLEGRWSRASDVEWTDNAAGYAGALAEAANHERQGCRQVETRVARVTIGPVDPGEFRV